MSEIEKSTGINVMDILNNAVVSGAKIEIVEKLLELKIKHDKHIARQAFFKDLAAAKAEMPTFVSKDKKVEFLTKGGGKMSYRHESFSGLTSAVNPVLSNYGLSVVFNVSQEKQIKVTCKLCHRLGHIEEVDVYGPLDNSGQKNGLQQIGSTISYLMRYAFKLIIGISAGDKNEDDDGRDSEFSDKDRARIFSDAKIAVKDASSLDELADIWRFAENNGLRGSILLLQLKKLCTDRKGEIEANTFTCPNGGTVQASECRQCGARAGCPALDGAGSSKQEAAQPQRKKGTPPPHFD